MAVVVDFNHIAGGGNGLWAEIVHKPDRAFDDMAQLPRTLIRPLKYGGGALQVITRKHVGGRHRKSPLEYQMSTDVLGGLDAVPS